MLQLAMEATKFYCGILQSGQQANLDEIVQTMTQVYINSKAKVVEAAKTQSQHDSLASQFK